MKTSTGLYFVVYGDPNPANDGILQLQGSSFVADSSGDTFVVGPASATPDPSSMILLGTGMLGLAGAVRRRFSVNA